MAFESLVISNGVITGSGSDVIGAFELNGTKDGNTIRFLKKYLGKHTVAYEGTLTEAGKYQKVVGEWHIGRNMSGRFELRRDVDLERQREAAFKMVVAQMKMLVGFARLFLEDVCFAVIQVLYLLHSEASANSLRFTVASLAAGLLMSVLGPLGELLASRRFAGAAGPAAASPPDVDGGKQVAVSTAIAGPSGGSGGQGGPEAAKTAEPEDQLESGQAQGSGYQQLPDAEKVDRKELLANAEKVELKELVSGNLDYIEMLMETPDEPAKVPDVAITDVIATNSGVHKVLIGVSVVFWAYVLTMPLVFQATCHGGIATTAHLCFTLVSFLQLFAQIWCAMHTKYGYLMLVHAPQQFGFATFLSFMGQFDCYSDLVFILMARACGSWLWKPAAAIYLAGVVLSQGLAGIAMLTVRRNLPAALKLLEMNVLLLLLKPSVG